MITSQQQRRVAASLYDTKDGIFALRKFNSEHGANVGELGNGSISEFDLEKMLQAAGFRREKISQALNSVQE